MISEVDDLSATGRQAFLIVFICGNVIALRAHLNVRWLKVDGTLLDEVRTVFMFFSMGSFESG